MDDPRARRSPLLWLLVLVSGASGLVFEIVWIRALGRHFGTTAPAIATVVAVFMGGLALGNAIFGRRADRSPRPLSLYRWLELGIGVSGLVVSLVLLHGDPLLGALARTSSRAAGLHGGLRVLLIASLLLLPTTLMGGTLPVLARALVRAGTSGRTVGTLYAVNTAGAVVGALLPDLVLVRHVGLTATVGLAALGNVGVALAAGAVARAAERAPSSAGAVAATGGGRVPYRAALLVAVSGFCAMGVQVLWSRVLEHWTSGWVTSFSLLLAVFLLALAAGSWATRRIADRVRHPLGWAAWMLAATGPAVLLPLHFAVSWRTWQAGFHPVPPGVVRPSLAHGLLDALLHAAYLETAACLLMGAAFPFVAAHVVREGSAGCHTGRLYALNTLAGVAGSLAAGFWLLPQLGPQKAFLLLTGLASFAGCALAVGAGAAAPRRAAVAGLAPAAVVLLLLLWPADHLRNAHFSGSPGRILSIHEGATTTAAVARRYLYGRPAYLELKTPGISMSDTSFGSRRYMGLMGHLGAFFAPRPERALLICYGVGNTARSLLSHPDLAQLDVVDIAEEVFEASPAFATAHGLDPLASPRATAIVDDGRHHLLTTESRYDVITSEPPPPNNAGVVNLYSREYYRLARTRLRQGGVLTQWLPVLQLAAEDTEAIVAAFVAEFSHTALFYGYGYQWILVGSDRPLRIDAGAWRLRAALPTVAEDLARIGVEGVGDLLGGFLQGDRGLREATRDAFAVTDDFPSIQYPGAAVSVPQIPRGLLGDPFDVRHLLVGERRDEELQRHRPALEAMRIVLRVLPLSGMSPPEARELVYGSALRRALEVRGESQALLALLKIADDRVVLAQEAVRHGAEHGGVPRAAVLTLVRRDFYAGRYPQALARLDAPRPETPASAHAWLLRAGAQRALGRADEAARDFERAASQSVSPAFRSDVRALALQAGEPFPPELGPFVRAPRSAAR